MAPLLWSKPMLEFVAYTRESKPEPSTLRAWNAAMSAWKPVVLALARLWLFAACALRVSRAPDIATYSIRSMRCSCYRCAQRMLMIVCVIWSDVEIIWALAWKLRCAVIMFTSCAVISTFDASRAPACTSPKPDVPA